MRLITVKILLLSLIGVFYPLWSAKSQSTYKFNQVFVSGRDYYYRLGENYQYLAMINRLNQYVVVQENNKLSNITLGLPLAVPVQLSYSKDNYQDILMAVEEVIKSNCRTNNIRSINSIVFEKRYRGQQDYMQLLIIYNQYKKNNTYEIPIENTEPKFKATY
jgi:hypothetical protein